MVDDDDPGSRLTEEPNQQAIVRIDNSSRKQVGKPLVSKKELKDLAQNLRGNKSTSSLTIAFCELDNDVVGLIGASLLTNTTLKTLNLWENKIGEKGGVALGSGLAQNCHLTELSLRGNELGPDGALGLAKGIMNHTKLHSLNLRFNNIGDYGAKSLAMVIMNNPTITKLDLSRNRISCEGIDMFMKSLWLNSTLTELNLQINVINDKGGIAIGTALVYNSTLTSLDIMGCKVGDIGSHGIFDALKHDVLSDADERAQRRKGKRLFNCTLKSLIMGGNDIGEPECKIIGLALTTNHGITFLDLSKNQIGDNGASSLAAALVVNSTLTSLILAENWIGDEGAKQIGDGLITNQTLTALSLVRNRITWKVDIDGFVRNTTLLQLANDFHLSKVQADIGHKVLDGFKVDVSRGKLNCDSDQKLDLFHHMSKKLISLHCEGNDIGAESVHNVQNSLGEYLQTSGTLLELNLSSNGLKCEHVKVLCFTSLTQLDLSNNSVSSPGAEHVITSLAKLRFGMRIREIDFSVNHIQKLSPMIAYLTTLELLLIRQNPVISMVPLTAIHAGEEAVTQWMHKWATQQIHLSEQTKGNTVKTKNETDEAPISNFPGSPSIPRVQRLTSLCTEYPAVFSPLPCAAVIGMSERCHKGYHLGLHLGKLAQSPGPANYSPYNFLRNQEKSNFVRNGTFIRDSWRGAIATSPKTLARIPHASKISVLTDEMEEAILRARKTLLGETFDSIAIPRNWNSCRHPKIMDTVKGCDPEQSQWSEAAEWGKPSSPGYDEKYGILSIVRKVTEENPGYNPSPVHVVQVLKKHGYLHSDQQVATSRPHFRRMLDTNSKLAVVPYKTPSREQSSWQTRQSFAEAVTTVFHGRQLEGFTDLFLKQVSSDLHLRIMKELREFFVELDWSTDEPLNHACRIIRDIILKGYWAFLKKKMLFDSEDSLLDAFRQILQNPDPIDQWSRNISSSPKMLRLFQSSQESPPIQLSSKHETDLWPGPGAYDPNFPDKAIGPSIGTKREVNRNEVPGPGAYSPRDCSQNRKIATGYIQDVGKIRAQDVGPGPAYEVPGCLDKHFSSAPRPCITSRSWFEFQRDKEANDLPGPGAYSHSLSSGECEVPIESKLSARTCATGPAFSHGLPRKLLPHLDADSNVRKTPGPKYDTSAKIKNVEKVSKNDSLHPNQPNTSVGHSKLAMKSIEVHLPGPGSYDIPDSFGTKAVTIKQSPSFSMAADTMWRSSTAVSHVSIMDRRCPSTATSVVIPRRPETQRARKHPAVTAEDEQKIFNERPRHLDSAAGKTRAHQWPPFATMSGTGPVIGPPSAVSRKEEVVESPGPSHYNVPSFIASRHSAVKNAPPAWPMAEDFMNRSCPDVVYQTLVDGYHLAVVSPKSPQTARARLHGTSEDSFGISYAVPTSKSECTKRKKIISSQTGSREQSRGNNEVRRRSLKS